MSVLDRVRAKYKTPTLATDKTDKRASVSFVSPQAGVFESCAPRRRARVGHGIRGDGRPVSWDGFLLDADGLVIIHAACDGAGCDDCRGTGLVLAEDGAPEC